MSCQFQSLALLVAAFDSGDHPPVTNKLDWITAALAALGVLAALWQVVEISRRKELIRDRLDRVKKVEKEFETQTDIRGNVELLVLSSPAASGSLISHTQVTEAKALSELNDQIAMLRCQIDKQRNEIVEVQKIDPVLEATLRVSVENLAKRLETVERQALSRWDVALVFLQLLGGLGVIISALFATLKYLQK